jgi:DNA-binding winged helix-turn-helix (wHTH) protein
MRLNALPKRSTLHEAMLACAEPEAAEEIRRLVKEGYDAPIIILGRPETEFDRGQSRLWHLRGRAEITLKAKLESGELTATGRDPGYPLSPRREIPAERWRYLEIYYLDSSVGTTDGRIIEVEISPEGSLQISRQYKRARLGAVELNLSDRSFELLLMLAEAAAAGRPFVSHQAIIDRFYSSQDEKALGQGIEDLKQHLTRSGIDDIQVRRLIDNVRGKGYRLNMPSEKVAISA